ncbi:hypothetical protein N0V83_007134 [Neocucurbitaria cava]|uniref:Uncharacterized protein n=1 Tax=Neocucurbitaria cava TaxID=798079 RepID=A0A9W8Y6C8_9PLEO|nr:hypothetical protein N0V83_007134 [Neocucurbitaria cava]
MHLPYEPQIEEEEKDDSEMPEITINAATQIRGNGNIISIAQMDSARIANLIASMLNGGKGVEETSPSQQPQEHSPPATPTAEETTKKQVGSVHITVNCGATIIGDRNIVGPGLGDIARQMQLAQRNQALHAQQLAQQQAREQQQQQAQQEPPRHHHSQQQQQQSPQQQPQLRHSPPMLKMPLPAQRRETLYQAQQAIAQHHGTMYAAQGLLSLQAPTPPLSRSGSFGSEGSGSAKRKAEHEHDAEEVACKKQC